MRRLSNSFSFVLLLASGCMETVTVGDTSDPDGLRADRVLAELASDMHGDWSGAVSVRDFYMEVTMTFEPADLTRAVTFRASCATMNCPLDGLDSAFSSLFGTAASTNGTTTPGSFPGGRIQLVELLREDAEGVVASIVFSSDLNMLAIPAELQLTADRSELVISRSSEPGGLTLTRAAEK